MFSICIEVLYIYYIYAEFHRLHLINDFTYLQGVQYKMGKPLRGAGTHSHKPFSTKNA